MTMDWEQFLDPYIQAVGELKIKLRGIRKQFRKQNRHSPIEFVTGRVKSVASIEEKIALRGLSVENLAQDMQDIAGLRVMVQFVDDVDEVLALLQEFMNFTAALEADDMTDDFVIEAAPMLVAVGGLAKYIRDENLETAFIQAAFCWLLLCQQAVLSPEMSVRVIGALQVNGLAPIIVFRERENDEDELYRNMVLQSLKGGGLPN